MGALSTYYNFNCYPYQPLQTSNNSEIITLQHLQQQQEQSSLPELSQFSEHNTHHFSSYLDETLIFDTPYFYSNETTYPSHDQLLVDSDTTTFSSQNDEFVSMNEIFPNEQDFNTYLLPPCGKRQKMCYEEKNEQQEEILNSANFFVDEFMTNPFVSFEAELCFAGSASKIVGCEKKVNEKTISSQSIAARERRRKITEKTQELGKLVPGGPKMNTAEMLSAAANYVKFLQAQVGMLQVMGTLSKEEKEPPPSPSEDLHKLLISPFVQEKLYSEEKCFVPKEFITTLTNNDDVRSKPTIIKGLKQLIGKEINEKKPKEE